jgi:hypothetical protein
MDDCADRRAVYARMNSLKVQVLVFEYISCKLDTALTRSFADFRV